VCRVRIHLSIWRKIEKRNRDHSSSSVVARHLNTTSQGDVGDRIGSESRAAKEEVEEAEVLDSSGLGSSVLRVQGETAGLEACGG